MSKTNKFRDEHFDFSPWVGKQVHKFSGKPFKSGNKIGTVKELTTNPQTGKPAFSFFEDESIVDAYQTRLVES